MIEYTSSCETITPVRLRGFFDGWPNPPSPETHLQLLQRSDERVIAIDTETGHAAGFITAITDSVLCAYIPLLEVLPNYQGRGIGRELVRRMLGQLQGFYMVDILCDTAVQPFYRALGMQDATGVMIRNYQHQSGKGPTED